MAVVPIRYEWLSPAEESALQRVVELLLPRATNEVCVRPFARFGFSGAKLFLLYFDKPAATQPFLIKIHTAEDIADEVEAYKIAIQHFAQDAQIERGHAFGEEINGERKGAICYVHVAADTSDVERVKEIKELAFNRDPALGEVSRNGLRRCYAENLRTGHSRAIRSKKAIEEEYKDYLRLEDKPGPNGRVGTRSLLNAALGSKVHDEKIELYGAPAYNPEIFLARLLKREIEMSLGPIHGDLHTSNLLFDPDGKPRLVDFAWCSLAGHLLKDYVLMENSIRFMIFPGNVLHEKELAIEEILLKEDGPLLLDQFKCGNAWMDHHLMRLSQLVSEVRLAAKQAMGANWSFHEYLIAQFLMLTGSLVHYDYSFRESVRCLGLIARELRKDGVA